MLVSVDLGGGTIASVVGVYASAQIEDRRWRNVPNRNTVPFTMLLVNVLLYMVK
jgi:hypothetical protein